MFGEIALLPSASVATANLEKHLIPEAQSKACLKSGNSPTNSKQWNKWGGYLMIIEG